MKYASRIERYLLQAMAIEPRFGLSQWMSLYEPAADSVPLEVYRRTVEDNKPVLYSPDGFRVENHSEDGQPLAASAVIASADQPVVAQVNLKGTMLSEGGLCTYGIDYTCDQIAQAGANPNVMGILLNTHSGGGEVVAAQRLSNAIQAVHKPVVQFVDGMAASGAYWVGAVCDEVVMGGRTTEVGSIGVVIQMNKQILTYLRENLISIFSDGSDGKQDVFRAILDGDFDFVRQKSLNPLRKEFVKLVKSGRKNVSDEALTGTMFHAPEAIKVGLADRIGNRSEAIQRVVTLSRSSNRSRSAQKALNHV